MRKVDENAFIAAYDQYAEPIFRYCYYRVYDRERARDLMQEAFTRTWEYLRRGNAVDDLRAFLYTTAHNACVNEIARKKAQSLDAMQEATGFDPAGSGRSPEEDADAALVIEALQALPASDAELLTLRYLDGLEVKEIARILNEKPNTVSVRIRRALDELRRRVGEAP
jgi:RNA polymerase sigma-70 factor (ECF subfamily)